ncbi:MAG TPA: hypothetical protein VLZ44_01630, partial [Treponemataceae bacterium]|nr:hypothetical protein [Treponemataceae bacterium]
MKKKGYQGILYILVSFSLILFFSSCGLPVYYIIYPPVNADPPSETPDGRYFSFKTADEQNFTSGIYRGIDVYYKIYNNKEKCDSDTNQIQAVNSDFSQSGFNKMQSLGYAKLISKDPLHTESDILFKKETIDATIKIRLFDEGDYKAGFKSDIVHFNPKSKPIRSNEKNFQFDEYVPAQDDADYTHNKKEDESDFFWVAAFAVSVGRDGFFQAYYSSLLPLGSIKI